MKKAAIIVLLNLHFITFSQLEFTTHPFDIEPIVKEKAWGYYGGYKNDNGELILKLGKLSCELTKEYSNANFKNDYKGLAWRFKEVFFDENMEVLKTEDKNFSNTVETSKYEPIWGSKFATLSVLGLQEPLSNEFIGKKTVISNFDMGGKLTSGLVVGKAGNGINRGTFGSSSVGCSELPDFKQISSTIPIGVKGEIWTGVKGYPIFDGGVALFQVGGTFKEKELLHYVLNQYDEKLSVVKSIQIDCDYSNAAQLLSLKTGEGKWDFIVVLQATEHTTIENLNVKEPDFAEIIHIDGQTFEIKYRTSTSMPFSNWYVRNAEIGQDESIYLFGPAAKSNEKYLPAMGAGTLFSDADLGTNCIKNNPKTLPNYQIARIKDGRVFNITGTDLKTTETKMVVLNNGGSKVSVKPSFNVASTSFYSAWDQNKIFKDAVKYYFKNSKIIVCFQPFYDRSSVGVLEHGPMVTAIFDPNGMLESYIVKPEKSFSKTDEFFSKDNKKMYVAYYDLETLNNKILDGSYTPKKVPNFIAANLQFAKIELNTGNKLETFENVGLGQFAVNANNPVLIDSPDEIIFLGKDVNKPGKDNEVLLINLKK